MDQDEIKQRLARIAGRDFGADGTPHEAGADAIGDRLKPVLGRDKPDPREEQRRKLEEERGVNTIVAATVVAEIGDIARFENPRQLMAWLGLVPSEHSSGSSTRRGRLTKTGNALARTMLVEAGWSYRHPPKEGQPYLKRSQHLPQQIRDIGWKAQTRLVPVSVI